ncbi:MAG TPA: PspA/IM30 family protein [Candidatus Acidoferrales bacterium]|jgi:phage shock protein A|nr:PspA/IM30 family protein [Candidatus Acidoferrales bacterium]
MEPETFLDRIVRVVRQKFNAKAEQLDDPAEAIGLVMTQQLEAINRTRADLANVAVAQKRLDMMAADLAARRDKYDVAARTALTASDEKAARLAARRAVNCDQLRVEAESHRDDVRRQREEVAELLEEMRSQYDRLQLRRESARGMATAARATAAGNATMSTVSPEGAAREELLQRARETLADLRARAFALADLRTSGEIAPIGATEFDAAPQIEDADVERHINILRASDGGSL